MNRSRVREGAGFAPRWRRLASRLAAASALATVGGAVGAFGAEPAKPAATRKAANPAPSGPPTWAAITASWRAAGPAAAPRGRRDGAVKPASSAVAAAGPVPSPSAVPPPPVVPPPAGVFPVDLSTALRLAEVENPEIAEARQRILEAAAFQTAAYALMLPTLNAGFTYHGHTGNLQRSSGRILSLSEQSLYVGGGARTLAAETVGIPAVNITSPLTDAIFEPLAARQDLARAGFEAVATSNSVLLDVATLYFDLVAAETALGLRRQTETEANETARLTSAFARSGQGYRSDADRAATLLKLIHREVEKSEEEAAVASARLSRRLHLDPVVRIVPVAAGIAPIALIDPSSPTEELVRVAIQGRPEMGARTSALGVARTRLKQEVARPLLPTFWLGYSGGGFGGGSNLVPPLLGNFGGRTDFDVRAIWTLQNLGMGNLALQKNRRAAIGQALGEQSLTINAIRREVAAARARVIAARGRMDTTHRQLETSTAGYREDLDWQRNNIDRPIELTNSLELLAQARIDHLRAILDYNKAQLRLFVSLGSPPPLDRPPTDPLPPAPVASPPLPLAPIR